MYFLFKNSSQSYSISHQRSCQSYGFWVIAVLAILKTAPYLSLEFDRQPEFLPSMYEGPKFELQHYRKEKQKPTNQTEVRSSVDLFVYQNLGNIQFFVFPHNTIGSLWNLSCVRTAEINTSSPFLEFLCLHLPSNFMIFLLSRRINFIP